MRPQSWPLPISRASRLSLRDGDDRLEVLADRRALEFRRRRLAGRQRDRRADRACPRRRPGLSRARAAAAGRTTPGVRTSAPPAVPAGRRLAPGPEQRSRPGRWRPQSGGRRGSGPSTYGCVLSRGCSILEQLFGWWQRVSQRRSAGVKAPFRPCHFGRPIGRSMGARDYRLPRGDTFAPRAREISAAASMSTGR